MCRVQAGGGVLSICMAAIYRWASCVCPDVTKSVSLEDMKYYSASFYSSVWSSMRRPTVKWTTFRYSPCSSFSRSILLASMLPQIQYTKINITFVQKFGPVFASEGGSATLTATMTLNPNLANLQPEAQWYRDGNCSTNCAIISSNIYCLPRQLLDPFCLTCSQRHSGGKLQYVMDGLLLLLIMVKVAIQGSIHESFEWLRACLQTLHKRCHVVQTHTVITYRL